MECLRIRRNIANTLKPGGEYGTALQAASFQGNTDNVTLLLDYRANANLQGEISAVSTPR
jgi:ribose 1,5-bisphosphokinase PhnN